MTKAELISVIAAEAELTKSDAEKVLKSLLETVTDCLKKGDKLSLVGFGTFSTVKRAARKGQNPQTGKKISIPASVAPKFKAGKALKDAVNRKKKK
ncbi:MAG TPA: HU family DNA-binding protein [Geobacteraceae bacterium]|nr:HU family DNA-binding protein [Geobacteraceae bacterium]